MCDANVVNQNMVSISQTDIQNLLIYFSTSTYHAGEVDSIGSEALLRSIELMKIDYNIFLINNIDGELSVHYPSHLVILEREHAPNQNTAVGNLNSQATQRTTNTIYENMYDAQKLRDLIVKARFARCRSRFPVPIILYKDKYICRSATLSGGPEIYGRSGINYFFKGAESVVDEDDNVDSNIRTNTPQSEWQLFDRVRSQDIKLLKAFNVGTIIDFMVEKKKVKFGMNITSSEKVDKENRYSNFSIISLPYPGCEFFKEFRDHNYTAQNLVFDWTQTHVDACICVPEDSIVSQLSINWNEYKKWDLVMITQRYMRLMLKYLQDNNSGMLIHCISGWDRTPLFISLLRLSLWADGLIHQGLDVQQILYLTIAYDWMLFGHHLVDRLGKGEEIFFFCFYMLKHISDDEFSISSSLRSKSNKLNERTTEKVELRTDGDLNLDAMLLEPEARGSNISLNSSCSSISNKSQEQSSALYHLSDEINNGNTVLSDMASSSVLWSQGRRTSPVAVPIASRIRQRQESLSSFSVGSWQLINSPGSIRSSDSASIDSNGTNSNTNRNEESSSQDSTCTLIDEEDMVNVTNEGCSRRKERLFKVRGLFYKCFGTAVGLKFKNDSSLSSILGNFAEKVGLSQRTTE